MKSKSIAVLLGFALSSSTNTFAASNDVVRRNEKAPQIQLRPMGDREQIEANRIRGVEPQTLELKFRVIDGNLKEQLEKNPNCHVSSLNGTLGALAGCLVPVGEGALIEGPSPVMKITLGALVAAIGTVYLVKIGQEIFQNPSLSGSMQWAKDAQLHGHAPFPDLVRQFQTLPLHLPPTGTMGQIDQVVTQAFDYPPPNFFHSEKEDEITFKPTPAENEVIRVFGDLAREGTLQEALGEAGRPETEEAKRAVEAAVAGLSGEAAKIARIFVDGCMTQVDVDENVAREEAADRVEREDPIPPGVRSEALIRKALTRGHMRGRPKVLTRIARALEEKGFGGDERLDAIAKRIFKNLADRRWYWVGTRS